MPLGGLKGRNYTSNTIDKAFVHKALPGRPEMQVLLSCLIIHPVSSYVYDCMLDCHSYNRSKHLATCTTSMHDDNMQCIGKHLTNVMSLAPLYNRGCYYCVKYA